jgi:hypothetical protein
MQAIENHWLTRDRAWREEMTAPEPSNEMPKWNELYWTKKSVIDRDGTTTYYLMTATQNGLTYEGTGILERNKLIIVDNIEIKK